MRSLSLVRFALCISVAISAAHAQQAGPPAEMKSPADSTSQTRPNNQSSTPTAAPKTDAPEKTAPDPAPVSATSSAEAAKPAQSTSGSDDKIPTTTIYPAPDAK